MINTNMSLFPISDIDYHFINICTPDILAKLSKINKYYYRETRSKLFVFQEFFKTDHFHTNEVINNMKFVQACYYGDLDILKYVTKGNIIQSDFDTGFQFACMRNKLNIAQYLIANYVIDVHKDNDYAFRWSCRNNCFDTAFWLLEKYKINEADIHLPMLYSNIPLKMKHFEYQNIKSIKVDWSSIFISQIGYNNFDMAKYIGITFGINFIQIYRKIIKFTDIDVDANDKQDVAITKIVDAFIKDSIYDLLYSRKSIRKN